MTRKTYCGNLLWQSGLTLLVPSVELFVRNTKGEWQFYYVDHEVWPWRRGGRLDFSDGKARVFCGDEPFLDIDIDEDGGSESCRYPAAMTAEGVFSCCRDK